MITAPKEHILFDLLLQYLHRYANPYLPYCISAPWGVAKNVGTPDAVNNLKRKITR